MSGDHNMNQKQESANDFHPDWDTLKPFYEQHIEDSNLLIEALKAMESINDTNYLWVCEEAITAIRNRIK